MSEVSRVMMVWTLEYLVPWLPHMAAVTAGIWALNAALWLWPRRGQAKEEGDD